MYGHESNGAALGAAGAATLPFTGADTLSSILAAGVLMFAGLALITIGRVLRHKREEQR